MITDLSVGTQVRFARFGAEHIGVVVAHLRYPESHPHCPGWSRLVVRAPGIESMVSPVECTPLTSTPLTTVVDKTVTTSAQATLF